MIDHGKDDPIPYPMPTEGECALHKAMMDAIREQVEQLNERDRQGCTCGDKSYGRICLQHSKWNV